MNQDQLQDLRADIMAVRPDSKGMAALQQFAIESLSKHIIEDEGIDCKAEIESDYDRYDLAWENGVSTKDFY